MWIKVEELRKGQKIIELGKKRGPGDPVYDDIDTLCIAINNLKNSIINSIPTCIINLCKRKGMIK